MNAEENEEEQPRSKPAEEFAFGELPSGDDLAKDENVLLSMYEGVATDDDRPEREARQDKEWSLRLTCAQEWFVRCSWINKFLFLEALCNSTCGRLVLENVLKSIKQIFSKDVVESLLNDSPEYDFDRIPKDDNRTLGDAELNQVMKDDFLWFVKLDSSLQTRVILRLLRLGGGGLIFAVYKSATKLFEERQQSDVPASASPSREANEEGEKDEGLLHNYLPNEYTQERLYQTTRRNNELAKYKKLRGLVPADSKTQKKGETKEGVDYLQILPIWLNRRILSYIDDKGLSGLKKVGKYWARMIDESINEKSGRKAINAKINKIVGAKPCRAEKKERGDAGEAEDPEIVLRADVGELLLSRENVDQGESPEFYASVLSKKFKQTVLDTSACCERRCAFDPDIGTLAGTNKNNMVHFYSVRTATRFNFSVFGFEAFVTCLALHQDRIHLVVGCSDGSLTVRDIRTNETTATFNGHTMDVISLFTTPSNLLSASKDNTIKCFQLWSGVCLLTVDLANQFNITSLLLRRDKPSLSVIGTAEGVVLVVDVNSKMYVVKAKLHAEEITRLAHDGDVLITGSGSGKVRVWSMRRLENSFPLVSPYHNVNVGSSVSSLTFYKNQIFAGCDNGTVHIISLLSGTVTKTMKIPSPTPVMGVEIYKDKLFMKLIIWHEGGIEIRTFSLPKSSGAAGKDNRESKQEAPKERRQNKTSHVVLPGYVKNPDGLVEVARKAYDRTTVQGTRIPLKDRACTLFTLRTLPKAAKMFKTDVFSKVNNSDPSAAERSFFFKTFARSGTVEEDRRRKRTNSLFRKLPD